MTTKPLKLEYWIIHDTDIDQLADKVDNALKDGWCLHGAPFVVPETECYGMEIAQALTQELPSNV